MAAGQAAGRPAAGKTGTTQTPLLGLQLVPEMPT